MEIFLRHSLRSSLSFMLKDLQLNQTFSVLKEVQNIPFSFNSLILECPILSFCPSGICNWFFLFSYAGLKYMFNQKLVTVWSAPNYCYRCGNVAAILEFQSTTQRQAKLFNAVPNELRKVPDRITTPYFLWFSFQCKKDAF